MTITVNGEPRELPDGTTVRALIDLVTPHGATSAAEVNQQLVPRRAQDSTVLKHGDAVEVVTLVGGG